MKTKFFSIFFSVLCLSSNFTNVFAESSPPYTVIDDQAKLPLLAADFAKRQVLKLRLANGLEAYIISDPKADKSAASLTVKVGSWDDPQEYPGLAHFLEHMLFLGTKKYPKESEFDHFIGKHDGSTNAYTTSTHTSFMFSVDNGAFPEALERFSDFFKEPLFNPSGVARELHAIDEEYAKNLGIDNMRAAYVHKSMSDKNHPNYAFSMGNSSTLAKVSREALIKWYQEHYSAHLMRLIVYSPLPLETLRDMVVNDFQHVPQIDAHPFNNQEPLSFKDTLNKMVYIEPIQNIRTLSIIWELPAQFAHMKDSKPSSVVCEILGDEGEKSLLAQLKRENLAEKIQCGEHLHSAHHAEMALEIELTDDGIKHVNEVIERVFQTIAMIKQKGFPHYLFDDIQRMAIINYQYQPREDAFQYVMKQARAFAEEDIATFPEQTRIIQKFDPQAVSQLLDYLTPQNARFYLTAPGDIVGITFDNKEKWLNTPYTIKPIDPNSIEKWTHAKPYPEINLPDVNPFIPKLISSKKIPESPSTSTSLPHPTSIINNRAGIIYFSQDTRYLVPKLFIGIEIKTPQIDMGDAQKVVLADLFEKSVTESLSPFSYPALVAGLKYDIKRTNYGLDIQVSGYSENADLLLDKILSQLKTVRPTEPEFRIYKDALTREYQNTYKSSPIEQIGELFKGAIFKKFTLNKQKANAIRKISYEKFIEYVERLFKQTYVEGLIYGDLSKQQAQKIAEKIFQTVDGSPYPKGRLRVPEVIVLPSKSGPYKLEEETKAQGNALLLAIEQPDFSFKTEAAQQILMQGMQGSFFENLRTKQQTGYILFNVPREIERKLFNIFAIQSNSHTPQELLSRFEQFIESYMQEIHHELPEEMFKIIKQALVNTLEQPPKDTQEMGALLQRLAFHYNADFDWISKRIEGFKDLTYDEFLKLSREFLGRHNKKRLAIELVGITPQDGKLQYAPLTSIQQLHSVSTYSPAEGD